jgi:phospholipase/carboxylesterase
VSTESVDLEAWPHLYQEGAADGPVLLLLHGTGGNEQDIAGLGDAVLPGATILAPRGRVVEHGSQRWFRRFGEGSFDVPDVRRRAGELAAFIGDARQRYALLDRPLVAIGFSNGANIALATLLLHPDVVPSVVAFSGMYPLGEDEAEVPLDQAKVLLLNGADDPMAPARSVDRLEAQLRTQRADVTRVVRAGSHGITTEELATAREWLARVASQPAA